MVFTSILFTETHSIVAEGLYQGIFCVREIIIRNDNDAKTLKNCSEIQLCQRFDFLGGSFHILVMKSQVNFFFYYDDVISETSIES